MMFIYYQPIIIEMHVGIWKKHISIFHMFNQIKIWISNFTGKPNHLKKWEAKKSTIIHLSLYLDLDNI